MTIAERLSRALRPLDVDDRHAVNPQNLNDYEPLGEAYEATDGGTTDVGGDVAATTDSAAGGYPSPVPLNPVLDVSPFLNRPNAWSAPDDDDECSCKRTPVRSWQTARYQITANDVATRAAFVVTPSGTDADSVTRVTLVASTENAIRVGVEQNDAQVGGYLPPWFPVTLNTGPVWITGYVAGATLDVFVEFES